VNDLEREAEELKSVSRRKPTAARRALVAQALVSKWEGTQVLAVKVLAGWGDSQSIGAIRHFLEMAFEKPYGWGVRRATITELADLLGPDDASWLANLCRAHPTGLARHELRPLIERLSEREA
jgi:hypothetical protein